MFYLILLHPIIPDRARHFENHLQVRELPGADHQMVEMEMLKQNQYYFAAFHYIKIINLYLDVTKIYLIFVNY